MRGAAAYDGRRPATPTPERELLELLDFNHSFTDPALSIVSS
jgi:hypothetical protein